MEVNERWALEEAYDDAMRQMNEGEEILSNYRHELYNRTSQLSDYVASFYRGLSDIPAENFNQEFQETVEEFNWELRKQESKLDEAREQEQKTFNRKLEE